MDALCFEDLKIGDSWTTPRRTVTETDVVNFAGITGDYNALHCDHEFAAASTFRRPLALEHGSDRRETLPKRVSDDPRQFNFRPKKFWGDEIFWSRKSFYAFLGWFWRIYGKTELTVDFLAVFRSRFTYSELCTTKNCRKYICLRSGV